MVKNGERFTAKIDGVNIYQFLECIDNTLTQQERIDKLYQTLYDEQGNLHPFFETLFSTETDGKDWFKVVLQQNDYTSDKHNVCNTLEKLANWILYSPDGERITKKTKYNFLTAEQMNKRTYQEMPLSAFQDSFDDMIYDEIIDFITDPTQNYRMEADTKITSSDIREISAIGDYQKLINHIKTTGGNKSWSLKKANIICAEMIKEQKWLKDYHYGTIVFKHVSKDSTEPDFDGFDYFEKQHIESLLKCSDKDLEDDVTCMLYDLDKLAHGAGLTKPEIEVYYHLRHSGKNLNFIAERMNCTKQYVSNIYKSILKKIMKRYEIVYEDWYYLNICRGKYKTCNSCSQVKLQNTHYFGKDASKTGGFKYICKKCEQKVTKVVDKM